MREGESSCKFLRNTGRALKISNLSLVLVLHQEMTYQWLKILHAYQSTDMCDCESYIDLGHAKDIWPTLLCPVKFEYLVPVEIVHCGGVIIASFGGHSALWCCHYFLQSWTSVWSLGTEIVVVFNWQQMSCWSSNGKLLLSQITDVENLTWPHYGCLWSACTKPAHFPG